MPGCVLESGNVLQDRDSTLRELTFSLGGEEYSKQRNKDSLGFIHEVEMRTVKT